jgi:glucose/arabinose dehydrogenase
MNTIQGGTAGDQLAGTASTDLILGSAPALARPPTITLTTVATGLGQILFATSAPGDDGLLVVATRAGQIRLLDAQSGQLRPTPLLDLRGQMAVEGEQGMLGFTWHPDSHANGRAYVLFSDLAGDTVLREYLRDPANPDRLLPASGRDLLKIPQPGTSTNHKAGWIGFGPDGMLYIATGDGAGPNDPLRTGQDPSDLLGSILRIDVSHDEFPEDFQRNYRIPTDNPFVLAGGAPEVWAYGLRNPYRASFDRGTGQLWIGDVGQARFEEINIGQGGANYGWPLAEGEAGHGPGLVGPVHSYGREAGDRAVTAGYLVRGPESPLFGHYLFGDHVSGRIWSLADRDGDGGLDRVELNDGSAMGPRALVSFAEDAQGQLYAVGLNGRLLRIDATPPPGLADGADTIRAGAGDDRVFAGLGDDRVIGAAGDDLLSGMEGADQLDGGDGADTLIGGADPDRLLGRDGDDALIGGEDADRLEGGAGADLLVGGGGRDVLLGGAGADRFRWLTVAQSGLGADADRVLVFNGAAGDRLDLSGLLDGAFAFIGTSAFAATGAQVRTAAQGRAVRVEISLDGGPADMAILVTSSAPLTAADFLL